MEVSHKRERLVRFTGSDEVRVNDRRYMDQLCQKMKKETHAQMRKDEEKRAEAERQRLRRLLAQGIITMDDMDEDSSLVREMKQKEHGRRGRKNSKNGTKNKKQRTQSAYNSSSPSRKPKPAPTPRSSKASYSPPPRTSGSSENKRRPETSPVEVESQMSRIKDKDEDKDEDEKKEGENDDREQNGDEEEIPEEGEEGEGEEGEGKTKKRTNKNDDEKRPMFERYEDPKVAEMRDEESVDALYRLADELIIPSYKPRPAAATQKAY